MLGPFPRVPNSIGLGWSLIICISNSFLLLLIWRSSSENKYARNLWRHVGGLLSLPPGGIRGDMQLLGHLIIKQQIFSYLRRNRGYWVVHLESPWRPIFQEEWANTPCKWPDDSVGNKTWARDTGYSFRTARNIILLQLEYCEHPSHFLKLQLSPKLVLLSG